MAFSSRSIIIRDFMEILTSFEALLLVAGIGMLMLAAWEWWK